MAQNTDNVDDQDGSLMPGQPARGHDAETFRFYAREAETYAARSDDSPPNKAVPRFATLMPPAANVLELGCGAGRDTAAMRRNGLNVTPVDGSPAMAAEAEKRLGTPVQVMRHEDIDWVETFDGIFANASLLHVPRPAMPSILGRIHRALVPGGHLYASFKAGDNDGRDSLGRYFNYPDEELLRGWLGAAGNWSDVEIEHGMGGGYDRIQTPWLNCLVRKAETG